MKDYDRELANKQSYKRAFAFRVGNVSVTMKRLLNVRLIGYNMVQTF